MTTTTEPTMQVPAAPDPAEAFAERMLEVFNSAALSLLLSVGHQVGIFECLSRMPAATSREIADVAGLQERYVRELLDGLTVAGVVEVDETATVYHLPAAHAGCLTAAAGPANLARMMQLVPMLAEVEQRVIACFTTGGGVGYEAFPRFHALMGEDSTATHDAGLLELVVPVVPGLAAQLERGIRVADVGCGSGHALNLLARAFPRSRFVGYDFSPEALDAARAEARAWGLANAEFLFSDVASLQAEAEYDLVTAFDAIHDQAHPASVLSNVARALRPGGRFLMVEIRASSHAPDNVELPAGTFLYAVSLLHCMTVSLAQGGDGLGTAWGRQTALRMLRTAGFERVRVHEIETDPFNLYYVAETRQD